MFICSIFCWHDQLLDSRRDVRLLWSGSHWSKHAEISVVEKAHDHSTACKSVPLFLDYFFSK